MRPERFSKTSLSVVLDSENDEDSLPPSNLLPALQSSVITIREGHSLDLVCASQTQSDVTWSASYLLSSGARQLPQLISVTNILSLQNVSTAQAGQYNCSTPNDFQVIIWYIYFTVRISHHRFSDFRGNCRHATPHSERADFASQCNCEATPDGMRCQWLSRAQGYLVS